MNEKQYSLEELLSMLEKADEVLMSGNIELMTSNEIISLCVARKQVIDRLKIIRDKLNSLLAGE